MGCACSVRGRLRPLGLEVAPRAPRRRVRADRRPISAASQYSMQARVAAAAEKPDEVLVPEARATSSPASGLRFADRGMHALKGGPDEWRLFLVQ